MLSTTQPSPAIDTALCDLLTQISTFSDHHFDAAVLHLSEPEAEALLIKLLQHWTAHLDGKLLSGLLLELRQSWPK